MSGISEWTYSDIQSNPSNERKWTLSLHWPVNEANCQGCFREHHPNETRAGSRLPADFSKSRIIWTVPQDLQTPPTKSLPTHSLPLCFQLDKTFLLPIKFACQKDPLAYTTTIKWETHPVARGHLWILRSGPVEVATVEIQKLWLLWINGYTGTPEATNSPICV